MKILFISHLYPTKENSACGSFVHAQAKWLARLGHEVDVVSPIGYFPFLKKGVADEPQTFNGVRVRYVNYMTFGNIGLLFVDSVIARKIRRTFNLRDYDLVYAHTVLPDGCVAAKLAKTTGVPFCTYVHGADVQKKSLKKYLKGKIGKNLAAAKKVLVNSSKTQRLVEGVSGISAQIVPLGIEKSQVYKKTKNRVLKIITVGNLVPEKGIDYAILAVNNLILGGMDLLYGIIGDGPEANRLKRLAKDMKEITFMGQRDNEFVQKKMAEADIFLLPSWNEAFGVVYIEALWQGTPVIGCEGQGVEDVLAKAECGIVVKPKNELAIQEAILCLSDRKLRQRYGKAGHKVVTENYLWENNIRLLERKLKEVAK